MDWLGMAAFASFYAEADTMNSSSQFNHYSPLKLGAIMVAIIFSYLCYLYNLPVCCDVYSYMILAAKYTNGEQYVDPSGVRLYGYPLFLAFNMKLANFFGLIAASYLVYAMQFTLYLLGVCMVSRQISLTFPATIANVCFFALLGNLFVYPYLVISITDGFSVSLLLFICYIILKLFSEPFPLLLNRKSALLSIALGFLVGFAIMVRPANISWLLLLLPVTIAWSFHCCDSFGIRGGQVLAICIGFALAVTPQLQLNWDTFGRFTFLPTYDLTGNQIQWGIANVKYATSIGMENEPAGLVYTNPAAHSSSETISWYFTNPLAGVKTIFLHIFSAFDFDYLFPYIHNYTPKYRFGLFLFSHFVLFWSLMGYVLVINSVRCNSVTNSKARSIQRLLLALYTCLVVGWVAVYALSAVENRFALPVVTAMLPLAVWALLVKAKHVKVRNWLYGLFCVYLLLAWQLSTYISSLKIV
jgi:hypothetical protein